MPSPLLTAPPWMLVSPSGVEYIVISNEDLESLPQRSTDIRGDQLSDLRQLIGLHGDARRPKLPLHKHNWQLRQSVKCVQHSGTGEYVFVVGGTASYFWENFGQHRQDMASFDVGRFQSYLNTGKIWTTGAGGQKVQIDYYSPKGSDVRWTLVQPPEHILQSAFVHEVRADAGAMQTERTETECSRSPGSSEVSLGAILGSCARRSRCHRLPRVKSSRSASDVL